MLEQQTCGNDNQVLFMCFI